MRVLSQRVGGCVLLRGRADFSRCDRLRGRRYTAVSVLLPLCVSQTILTRPLHSSVHTGWWSGYRSLHGGHAVGWQLRLESGVSLFPTCANDEFTKPDHGW
jgi:hypothetical protein